MKLEHASALPYLLNHLQSCHTAGYSTDSAMTEILKIINGSIAHTLLLTPYHSCSCRTDYNTNCAHLTIFCPCTEFRLDYLIQLKLHQQGIMLDCHLLEILTTSMNFFAHSFARRSLTTILRAFITEQVITVNMAAGTCSLTKHCFNV